MKKTIMMVLLVSSVLSFTKINAQVDTVCFNTRDTIDNTWSGGWSYKEYIVPSGYIIDSVYGNFDRAGYAAQYEDFIFAYCSGTTVFDNTTAVSPFNYSTINTSLYDRWIDLTSYNYASVGVVRVFLPVNAGATWNDLCFAISSVPLPIELNNVAAKLSNNTFSHIKWQTSHEETTKEFILERSIDGYKFTDIATVKSKNSAQMSEYEYVDNISNLEPGEIYYRIKEVNFSAKVNISRIVFVTKLASFISNVTIKPNPSAGVYKVSLNLQDDSEIKVNVVNIFGQHIITNASNLVKGNNAIQLDLSAFQKGIYFIQIVGKESFITEKVILVK